VSVQKKPDGLRPSGFFVPVYNVIGCADVRRRINRVMRMMRFVPQRILWPYLETEWRDWVGKQNTPTTNADGSFITFCKNKQKATQK